MKFHLPMIFAALLFAAPAVQAQVSVTTPWVRATVPGQKSTGAFMKITSKTEARLVAARTPIAGRTEIHEMAMIGDTMRMRQIPSLRLPAGEAVELKPGGFHVMLFELAAQAREGDAVPLMLVIEADGKQQTVETSAEVRSLKSPAH